MKALWVSCWSFARDIGKPFLIMLLLMGVVRSAVADWNDVPTGSMKPTILEGDRIFVNKLAYDLDVPFTNLRLLQTGAPARGDIVVFFSPTDGTRMVKRVVGLPGDTIAMRRHRIDVNGQPIDYEPGGNLELERRRLILATERLGNRSHPILLDPARPNRPSFGPIVVPAGHYFVLGDNRDNSRDSRWFGFVPGDAIEGRATGVALSVDPANYYKPRWGRFFSRLQ